MTTIPDGTVTDLPESRMFEVVYDGMGKTRTGRRQRVVGIRCPFCDTTTETFVWSLAGSGKRCQCGALFQSNGAYPGTATR